MDSDNSEIGWKKNDPIDSNAVLHKVFEIIDNCESKGMDTGFVELDAILAGGLQNGEVIVVAGRPSMGKTAFAMNIIEHVSVDDHQPCAVFSLETKATTLMERILGSRAEIAFYKMRKGLLLSHEFAHLANTIASLAKAQIWIDDSPGLTINELCLRAKKLKKEHDIKLLVIDYIQLMVSPVPRDNREEELADISRNIKALARELDIPIVCLSQLNRASDGSNGLRPRICDLRGSGAIEEDADVVILLHRDDGYRSHEPRYEPDHLANVTLIKQRNGSTGEIVLAFYEQCMRFKNIGK